jgi:hypothetical protein
MLCWNASRTYHLAEPRSAIHRTYGVDDLDSASLYDRIAQGNLSRTG